MAEVLHFGVGQDEQGYFYAVQVRGKYLATNLRFETMEEAVEALMVKVDRVKLLLKDRRFPEDWTN
jgi:hypothetical protein